MEYYAAIQKTKANSSEQKRSRLGNIFQNMEVHTCVWLQPPLIDRLGQLHLRKNTENANRALGTGVRSDERENDLIFFLHILMYS